MNGPGHEGAGRIVTLGLGANVFRSEGNDEVRRALEGDGDPDNPITRYFVRLTSEPGVDREALVACMRSARPPLTPEKLGNVMLPVLIVIGDRDFAGPAEPLAEAPPNARLVILRGVDHFATPKNFGANGLVMITIDQLIADRRRHERLVRRVSGAAVHTQFGPAMIYAYQSVLDGIEHAAAVYGDVSGPDPVLVRVHSECLTGDVLASARCDCGPQLRVAQETIAAEGRGVIVY